MSKRKQSGFTLIELIIGIGFLVAVGLIIGLIYVGVHFIGKAW